MILAGLAAAMAAETWQDGEGAGASGVTILTRATGTGDRGRTRDCAERNHEGKPVPVAVAMLRAPEVFSKCSHKGGCLSSGRPQVPL